MNFPTLQLTTKRQKAIFLIAILLLVLPPMHPLHAYCRNWTAADVRANALGAQTSYYVAAVMAFIPGMQLGAFAFLTLGFAADMQSWYCSS